MNLVREEKLDRQIKKEFEYNFDISKEGLYAIEISARAKSWLQNTLKLISFFKDDDLVVKIDNKEFLKLNRQRGLFDSEAAWNGNALKNLQQINVFLVYLDAGKHSLKFIADQSPLLETIRIYQVTSERNIVFEPVKNYQIESGDRRLWLNFILVDLALEGLKIQASANQRQGDDDDLQLKINGERQTHNTPKSHKYWYWCGRILRGQSKTFDKELNLPEGLHYIELWADAKPILEKVEIEINTGKLEKKENKKRVEIPTVDDPKWTGDFYDDPEEIILARLVFGEAESQPYEAKIWVAWSVINRIEAESWWPDTVHKVILQKGQYDPFKPNDRNFRKITDPLGFKGANELTKNSWYECYEIAKTVVLRETANPTEATHFHGIGVTMDWFETNVVPNGKFLQRIGDTYFYWSPN